MFRRQLELFRAFGFPIRIDVSWIVIAGLVAWSLADGFFPGFYENLSLGTYWWMAAAGTIGLFASIVLHELSHALAARQFGLRIRGITLFIFGGVAEMESEPPNPVAEFVVAVAGPVASILIAGSCFLLYVSGSMATWPDPVNGVLYYLAMINGLLVVFNLLPAFPLDGGRVLRSALWQWRGDLPWATRLTSAIGGAFGFALIALGVLRLVQGFLVGGLWWILIGLFLRHAARMSYRGVVTHRLLARQRVARFVDPNPVTVSRALPLSDLVERFIYRHSQEIFPVVDSDRLIGSVSAERVKEVPREEWHRQSVNTILEPAGLANTIGPHTSALDAMRHMTRSSRPVLMVAEEGRLLGTVSLQDISRFLELKSELEGGST